jgi:hypothetical protein
MGILAAALTLATNKGYLGWTHYPWDPAVFGLVLVVAAAFLSRRFRGRRTGITAEDVWKAETHGLEPAALGAAILSPTIAPSAAPPRFGGGASGGGGASSGF